MRNQQNARPSVPTIVRNLGLIFVLSALAACGGSGNGDADKVLPGTIAGTVRDADAGGTLGGVWITVVDANTSTPVVPALVSDNDGGYEQEVTPGTYTVRFEAQGYEAVPAKHQPAVPITVREDLETRVDVSLQPLAVTDLGLISGTVRASDDNLPAGVLVVADDGALGHSSISDAIGRFKIFNVPPAAYTVQGWRQGFNGAPVAVAVAADERVTEVEVAMTADANAALAGQVSFLATENAEVYVSLAHPISLDVIPGLRQKTAGQRYAIDAAPNGRFLARASFENDGYVIDPDWIVKFGEPLVELDSDAQTLDFSLTGAAQLSSPTNAATDTTPYEIATTTPTFEWRAYASASDYVVEVRDAQGRVIWGGFSDDYAVKVLTIPKAETAIEWNADGQATEVLRAGATYQWRVYVSKDDQREAAGWKLISVSEDQRGLFRVVDPDE